MTKQTRRGVAISNDRKSVRVDVNASMSAAQLGEFIALLAQVRAGMEPNGQLSVDDDAKADSFVRSEPGPVARGLTSGGVRLWLRSQGLGWLAFDLTSRQTLVVVTSMTHAVGNLDYAIGHLSPNPFRSTRH